MAQVVITKRQCSYILEILSLASGGSIESERDNSTSEYLGYLRSSNASPKDHEPDFDTFPFPLYIVTQ